MQFVENFTYLINVGLTVIAVEQKNSQREGLLFQMYGGNFLELRTIRFFRKHDTVVNKLEFFEMDPSTAC